MRLGLLLGLMVWAGPVCAQDVDCANAQAQMEMNFCARQEWQVADADLNDAYKSAMALMKTIDADLPKAERGAEDSLRAAQRAWVTFRDAACTAEGYPMHGGSAEPMVVNGCLAQLTRQRAKSLWELAATY